MLSQEKFELDHEPMHSGSDMHSTTLTHPIPNAAGNNKLLVLMC